MQRLYYEDFKKLVPGELLYLVDERLNECVIKSSVKFMCTKPYQYGHNGILYVFYFYTLNQTQAWDVAYVGKPGMNTAPNAARYFAKVEQDEEHIFIADLLSASQDNDAILEPLIAG